MSSLAALIIALCFALPGGAQAKAERDVRTTLSTFEQGLQERKLPLIEKVVAEDIVVLENGERNDGWADFRDNHLVPEMQEPAPAAKPELMRLTVKGDMAWAYSKTTFQSVRRGVKKEVVVWS